MVDAEDAVVVAVVVVVVVEGAEVVGGPCVAAADGI